LYSLCWSLFSSCISARAPIPKTMRSYGDIRTTLTTFLFPLFARLCCGRSISQICVASVNRPMTDQYNHRVSGFLRGKEHFGHNCRSSRSVAVRGTEASSPGLWRTWLHQAQDISGGPRGVLEVHTRKNRGVGKADFIVNSITHISLSSPKWQISYGRCPCMFTPMFAHT